MFMGTMVESIALFFEFIDYLKKNPFLLCILTVHFYLDLSVTLKLQDRLLVHTITFYLGLLFGQN